MVAAAQRVHGTTSSSACAPSKSTLYVANLDYKLTNNDLHTVFSLCGHISKVSVLKNKDGEWARQSKGLAFVQFTRVEDALNAVSTFNGKELHGRTLKVSIAADNGRAREFLRHVEYPDKSRCFECGGTGHLSYDCPRNQLGPREHPQPNKKRKRKAQREPGLKAANQGQCKTLKEDKGEPEDDFGDDWASVVHRIDSDLVQQRPVRRGLRGPKKSTGYFSDESGSD